MDRSDPVLVPEWLRSNPSGSSSHHFTSSSQSGIPRPSLSSRNRTSRVGDKSCCGSVLDRSNSLGSRRNSGNICSTKHPYSSFTRSQRDKNRDKDKERSSNWIQDYGSSDTSKSILHGRPDKNSLRPSQSLVSGTSCDALSRRTVSLNNAINLNHNSGNCSLSSGRFSSGIGKAVSEKDFPTLGVEDKPGGLSYLGRVSSLDFVSTLQSSPTSNSTLISHDGWTSALVEVPVTVNSTGPTSAQHNVVASQASGALCNMVGLSMAEALSQNPINDCTTTQETDRTQKLEELAIKQSKLLIPITPSMPKPLVVNSFDRLKQPKNSIRCSEMTASAKIPHQQLVSQSTRVGLVRSDEPKTSNGGKSLIHKQVLENGLFSMSKDVSISDDGSSGRVFNTQHDVTPGSVATSMSSNSSNVGSEECKRAAFASVPGLNVKKRPSFSQAQSRHDFFNLMRKKAMMNASSILTDSAPTGCSVVADDSGQVNTENVKDAVDLCVTESSNNEIGNNDNCEDAHRFSSGEERNICLKEVVYTDEEVAFLRSLGWEENENAGDDEGLTEEEISAFYQEYMKVRPSLKACRGYQPKFLLPTDFCEKLGELR